MLILLIHAKGKFTSPLRDLLSTNPIESGIMKTVFPRRGILIQQNKHQPIRHGTKMVKSITERGTEIEMLKKSPQSDDESISSDYSMITETEMLQNSSQSDDESISSDHSMIYTLISTAELDDDEVEPEDSCDSLNLETAQIENYADENKIQESEESAKKEQTKQVLKEVGLFAAKAALISGGVIGGIALAVPAMGFGAGGVAAGSLAALYQSTFLGGTIASGSAFAVLQSIGAAGLAASTQAALVGGSVAATGIQTVISKVIKSKKEKKNEP